MGNKSFSVSYDFIPDLPKVINISYASAGGEVEYFLNMKKFMNKKLLKNKTPPAGTGLAGGRKIYLWLK